jgi:hypothetical protein
MSEREELEQEVTSREPASPEKLLHLLTAVVEAANDWNSWPRDLPPALQQKLPRLIAKIRADVAEIRQIHETCGGSVLSRAKTGKANALMDVVR